MNREKYNHMADLSQIINMHLECTWNVNTPIKKRQRLTEWIGNKEVQL